MIWNIFILEIWRFEKRIALSEKKPPLVQSKTKPGVQPAITTLDLGPKLELGQTFIFQFALTNRKNK